MKHKPNDISAEKWREMWNNAGYLLRPFAALLQERMKSHSSVNANDFNCPNHYAKMVWESGKKEEDEFVLSLLPDTAKN
jgi:hypothetical protein